MLLLEPLLLFELVIEPGSFELLDEVGKLDEVGAVLFEEELEVLRP